MKNRIFLKNIGLAILAIPMTSLIWLVIITVLGAIDDYVSYIQSIGHWWISLVISFLLSFLYFQYKPEFKKNRERVKLADSLIEIWKEKLAKENKPQPYESEVNTLRELLIERIKVYVWFDPDLWKQYFPDEKYPKYPSDIVKGLDSIADKHGFK